MSSKAAKLRRTVNLRHFVIWVSGKNCSYSRQKRHKLLSSQEGDGETVPDAENPLLSGLADEEVDKLLKSEENQALLKDLGSAMGRVDSARKELDEIEKREKGAAELRAYIQRLEGADSVVMNLLLLIFFVLKFHKCIFSKFCSLHQQHHHHNLGLAW
jgi:hypothetical protein